MSEAVVQNLIRDAERSPRTPEVEESKLNTYKTWLEREANHVTGDSTHSGRISAIKTLIELNREAMKVDQNNNVVKGGVMIVPALPSPEEWGEGSSESQDALHASMQDLS